MPCAVKSFLFWIVALSSIGVADEIRFSAQIRPILSDNCFQCHGPDPEERKAELRLDLEANAKFVRSDRTAAIVSGDTQASTILERITSSDPDLQMPPPDSGKQLSRQEIDLLTQWVESGAVWGKHWAFERVVRPSIALDDKSSTNELSTDELAELNAIDYFINRRLHKAALSPNPEADKRTLLRRVTLDLTGLPPTPAELNAFLSDQSATAYERVVDRLLQSPRYGEHMARFWLDAARYGDTHGLHLDNYREMWAYRDWVVNAFNSNMPFDQFTKEQLAGDLLPSPTDDQLIATGFNRCHVTTGEGGSIEAEVEVRNTVDRVVTTGAVFMGLTMDCCRCHTHKFDPLTIQDFYSFYSFFNSIDGNPLDGNTKDHAPLLKVLTPHQKQEVARLDTVHRDVRKQIDTIVETAAFIEPESPAEPTLSAPTELIWVEETAPPAKATSGTTPWQFAKAPLPVFSGHTSQVRTAIGLSQHYFEGAERPVKISDGDLFFAYVYLDPVNPPKEIMLQWHDGSSWNHRAYWGSNSIAWGDDKSPSRLHKGSLPKPGEWTRLEVKANEVGFSSGTMVNGWAFTQFDGTVYWDHSGILSNSSQQPLYDSYSRWQQDQIAANARALPTDIAKVALQSETTRSPLDATVLKNYFLEHSCLMTHKVISPLHQQLADVDQQLQAIQSQAGTTLIYRERAESRPAFVLHRGEYDQPREKVERRVPAVLPPMPAGAPNNRLGLAMWLTSVDHPLTSRVTVNRIWQQFFGTGIVRTAEDFGSQGERPSHPELLDWLSSELMTPELPGSQHSWDVKHLIKTIVTSAAYRRDALVTPQSLNLDPANRLLSRGPRFRLDAETLRDQALFLSGLYVEELGGPAVKPPQPDGLWLAVGYSGSNTVRFVKDNGPSKVHRRTLYTFIKRTAPPPQLAIMDAPSRESCVLRRERTNSPMQALMLMNDPQFVECARALAEKALAEGGNTPDEIVTWMIQRCLLRTPDVREVQNLIDDFEAYRTDFKLDTDAAVRLTSIGENPPTSTVATEDLAAWTMIANTLLNLDESVSR